MSVWFAVPSARPYWEARKCIDAWRGAGYKVAVFVESMHPYFTPRFPCYVDDEIQVKEYPGYANAVNALAKRILSIDPDAQWIVTGGDDTFPDPEHSPEQIAEECEFEFLHRAVCAGRGKMPRYGPSETKTFGIMQPTGDRFAGGSIDRIAGSPWMGREWCLRANQGAGPLYPGFRHMFVDECAKRTAEKLGVYWPRRDLCHFHRHFQRESDAINSDAVKRDVPPHLVQWNTPEHWAESKKLFKELEAEGFARCMPL